MPTGRPIANPHDALFAATRRVLVRGGPSAVTSRAITTEAGVAKGVLHRHFSDLDAFLAAFVVERVEALDADAQTLRAATGEHTVADNLSCALASCIDLETTRTVALVTARRDLLARLSALTPPGLPLLAQTTRMLASYLTAERALGRIPAAADVDALARALVSTVYVTAAGRDDALPERECRNVVIAALPDSTARRTAPR